MSNARKIKELINEFLTLEAMGEQMRQQAYRARVKLERLSAPAPSGVKKAALSTDQKVTLVTKFRKSTQHK